MTTESKKTVQKRGKKRQPVRRVDLDGIMGPCVASVIQSRLQMFSPSLKAVPECEWTAATPWGSVTVKGRISQIHRSILDAIFAEAIVRKENPDGSLSLVIDPYVVSKAAGVGTHDRKWLQERIEDLVQTLVRIQRDGEPFPRVATVIQSSTPTEQRVANPGGAVCGDRALLHIVISSAWMEITETEIAVRYKKLIPKIVALRTGSAQSLVRFVLTHRSASFHLSDCLTWIGALRADMSVTRRYEVISDIRKEAEALKRDFGLLIEKDTVFYTQHPDVRFAGSDD